MLRTNNERKRKRLLALAPVLLLLLLVCGLVLAASPAARADDTDWHAKYLAMCSQEPIVYPAPDPDGELAKFPYALLTPATKDLPDEKAVVIFLMGDGFKADEQDKFNYYAQYFAETIPNYEPFREFKDRIKVYRVNTVSEQSGIRRDQSVNGRDIPGLDPRNNYFGGICWSGNAQRGMSVTNRNLAISTAEAYANITGPNNTTWWKLLLMNTSLYGGVSSGELSFSGLHWSFLDVCIHESGHTNGLLPDEYHAGDRYFTSALENKFSYPNLVNRAWIDDPEWQEWNPWHRFLGKDGVGFVPFAEVVSSTYDYAGTHFRPTVNCKMRFVGYNDYYEKYGEEEFPFCPVCQEKWRDRLAIGSETPVFHFQPYNDQFYDNVPVTLNHKHFILRTGVVDTSLGTEAGFGGGYSQKIYGEDMTDGELKFTVRDGSGAAVYTDIDANTPMTLSAGTYTVEAVYDGPYGHLTLSSIDNSFQVHHASPIVSVGKYAEPWNSEDKMDTLTRPWIRNVPVTLPDLVVDASRVNPDASASDFIITYSWHLDEDGEVGAQLGSTGTWGGEAADGPSSVDDYILRIRSLGKQGTPVAGYESVDLYPFSIQTSYYSITRFPSNSTTYPNENEQNMWRPITIVGEGFTEAEYDKFVALADDFITKFLDTSPVNHLFERFYFWVESTLSQDSGISKPGALKDTYYGFMLDENNQFTTYRTDRDFNDILRQEVWRRDTNMKTAAQWGATVVFVNDDTVQANANWRHDPELNRSVHLATIKDKDYTKLIEEIVNQFAFCLSSRDPNLLDRHWMGDPALTQETLEGLIASCYCQHMPVVASDACDRVYVLKDGQVRDVTDPEDPQPFNVPGTFKAYAFGEEIITNTVEDDTFTFTYYADDNYSVGQALNGPPTEPGVYWAQAHLPKGNKYFRYDNIIYGKDFDDRYFYGVDANGNYIYDKNAVPEEYIVRAGTDVSVGASAGSRSQTAARGIVRFVIQNADKRALEEAVEAAEALEEELYAPGTWSAFQQALTAARQVLANENATQDQVDAALAALTAAQAGLVLKADLPSKERLQALVTQAEGLEQADYTPASWTALPDALTAAQAVLAEELATEQQITQAIAALEGALNGLVKRSYDLVLTAGKGGTVKIARDGTEGSYPWGEEVKITAKPKEGYVFDRWTIVSGGGKLANSREATTYFTMPKSDVKLKAVFVEEELFTIKVIVGSGGTVKPGTTEVKEGENQTFTIKPDAGYKISKVLVDGKSVGAVTSYTFRKVDEDHKLEAQFELISPVPVPTPTPTTPATFKDVPASAWSFEAVEFVAARKLFLGVGDQMFGPKLPMSRAMFVTVLGRLAESRGQSTAGFSSTFKDVPANTWYTQYVGWGAAKGVVKGYSAQRFAPNDSMTREQMAALIVRFADYMGVSLKTGTKASFSDAKDIGDWAKDSVDRAVAAGLMQGSGGKFNPKGLATREEVAQVMMNLIRTYLQ